jgi:hypothetical protein
VISGLEKGSCGVEVGCWCLTWQAGGGGAGELWLCHRYLNEVGG